MIYLTIISCAFTAKEPVKKSNLVVITLDTTRQDRIGAYGYPYGETSTIDSFAERGHLFTKAYSTVPLTTPSHASMFTGLYPSHHGIRNNGDAILPEELTTLAEHLTNHGYDTAASVSAFVTTRVWNLDQGFNNYFDELPVNIERSNWGQERPAQDVVNDLLDWFPERDSSKPYFVWAHFYDPHDPHEVTEQYQEGFRDLYDAEIAYVDDQIKRLLEGFGGDKDTIWVLIADHGEAFNHEHNESSHGLYLFDPTMKIPFIIKPSEDLERTNIITQPVSVIDLTPTVLSLLNVPPLKNIDGIDVLSYDVHARDSIYMESVVAQQRFGFHPEIAALNNDFKLMATPNPLLFNLNNDPLETDNLFGTEPVIQEQMARKARALFLDEPFFSGASPAPEAVAQLQALGYMSTDFDTPSLDEHITDAKDMGEIITHLEILAYRSKDPNTLPSELEREYRQVLENYPEIREVYLRLGQMLVKQNKLVDALEIFEQALALNPTSTIIKTNIAMVFGSLGRFSDGIAILELILEQVPDDKSARKQLLRMLSDNGQHEKAIQRGKEWLSRYPKDLSLKADVGVILVRQDQHAIGRELLNKSLQDTIPREHVHRSLAKIALIEGRLNESIELLQTENKYFPDPTLSVTAGDIYFKLNNWESALEQYCAATEKLETDALLWLKCAQSQFNAQYYERSRVSIDAALRLAPKNPNIWLLHANILAKEGHTKAGKEAFNTAKELLGSRANP